MSIWPQNIWILLGGLNAGLAVAAGAYGWHALANDDMFMMASQYQMWHALGMLGTGLMIHAATSRRAAQALHAAGVLFMAGIILFCGTLYTFGQFGTIPVEGAAPIGGVTMMAAWVILAVSGGLKLKRP